MTQRKRSRDEFEQLSNIEIEDAASQPQDNEEQLKSTTRIRSSQDPQAKHSATTDSAKDGDEWIVVESRSSKRRKKLPKPDGEKYPSISHSSHARLQSFVKISDLQNLILYLLADGTAPQWCSVANHANVKKVVALMVPGLENGMFDDSIPLDPSNDNLRTDHNTSLRPLDNEVTHSNGMSNNDPENGQTHSETTSHMQSTTDSANGSEPDPAATLTTTATPETTPQSSHRRKLPLSPDDYYPVKLKHSRLPSPLQPLAAIFTHLWPIKTPGDERYARMHSPLASMLTAPIPKPKEEKANKGKGPHAPPEARQWKNTRTPITEYLATVEELLAEDYVLHPATFSDDPASSSREATRREERRATHAHGWVDTPHIEKLSDGDVLDARNEKGSLTKGRNVFALDCEMCITSTPDIQPPVFSLTRLSMVDWDGNVVLDELVKPANPITNYLTPYSGITPQMMEDVTTTLADAQTKLLQHLSPHAILVGHSLNSDLTALQLTHPFIVDTALLFPHPRGPPLKSSLKWLAQKYLSRAIQTGHGSTGHNSIEDARAALDLVKQKCERGKLWGTNEASSESIFQRLSRSNRPRRYKVQPDGEDEPRTGAVVDWGEPSRGFGSQAKVAIGCEDDIQVVKGVQRALHGADNDNTIPTSGVDLVWARFRALEAYRGWWNKSKTQDADALRENSVASLADASLADVAAKTVGLIHDIWDALPPCTAFIVYSGSGDPRKLSEMQEMKQRHKAEFLVKKWDELDTKWTDDEEQLLRKACETARKGLGFITVK